MTQTVKLPDGTSLNFPDGMSQPGMSAAIQKNFPQFAPKQSALDRLPPATSPTAQPQKNTDTLGQRVLGAGEAGLSAITGAAGGAAGQLYGIGKTLTSGKYGTQAGIQEGEKAGVELANKLTYQPRTQTGQQLTEGVGRALEASRLQGLPVEGGMIGRIPEIPGAALRTAEGAADINRAVGRTAAAPAKALTRKAIDKLPDLDPATKQLASDAHGLGFRLTPDQVYGNKYGKFAGELAGENPLIKNNREHNQAVFNQQLVKQLGGEGDKLTRKTFNEAMKKSGSTIGDIAEKTQVPLSPEFTTALRNSAVEAGKFQTSDVARVVGNYIDEITDKSVNGVLPGKALRAIDTKIGNQIRNTANSDLKYALGDVQDTLRDAMNANLSEADRAALATARRQYAVGKTLEPLVAKAPTGDIPPSLLLGAITSTKAGKSAAARGATGDLGKLADIGQKFLKPLPSSGTAERSFMQNLLTHPLGTLAAGGTAAATAPLAAGYNRYGPSITQRLIDRPPAP